MKAERKIIEVLVDSGIDHVFVYPGGATIPVINALYDVKDKIRVILSRNEQTASCMANVYGRLTGKPGVSIAQGPFAASTGLFGILESQVGSAPMVVLTDITDFGVFGMHSPAQCCSGEYGSINLKEILRSACKYVASPVTPAELVQGVQQAIKHALSGRPGPTAVLIRSSNLSGEIDRVTSPKDLGPALSKAYRSDIPVVLDVLINREEKIYEKLYSPLAKEVMTFLSKKNLYYG